MISQALFITVMGMGGVFAFLILLIGAMHLLHLCVKKTNTSSSEKIAVAIAVALSQE